MAHRPSSALSSNNLAPPPRTSTPGQIQQRRKTVPSLPPPGALNLPEPVYGQRETSSSSRPPSPLRNGFVPQFADPVDSDEEEFEGDDDEDWGPDKYRSTSPGPSVTQFATNLASRVNSLLTSPVRPTSSASSMHSGHMTDAELEADAERERDQSRREAERILTQEANERKAVEERVLALMHSPRGGGPSQGRHDLAPPVRSQTMPAASPPSPSASQKENAGGWWAVAKNKLTSTKDKEPLTPAQQVIQEAKERQEGKPNGKAKEREAQGWFSSDSVTPLNLAIPGNTNMTTPRKPVTPTSGSPNNNVFRPAPPPDLTPSPMRGSPSREPPPLYAQFNAAGTLDVAGTLLVIARRFEKLEKWSVGHVRALEERMSDVERWLVDKEKDRERDKASLSTLDLNDNSSQHLSTNGPTLQHLTTTTAPTKAPDTGKTIEELQEIREEVTELQGRVGELGREVAKLATAPANLSSGPFTRSPLITTAPLTPKASSVAAVSSASPPPTLPDLGLTPRRAPSLTARDSTSPPIAAPSPTASALSPNSRLPYPTGDYTSPPSSPPLPSVLSSTRPLNIPGLPNSNARKDSDPSGSYTTASSLSSSVSSYGSLSIPHTVSPPQSHSRGHSPSQSHSRGHSPSQSQSRGHSPSQSQSRGHSPSNESPASGAGSSSKRTPNASPTPRKRYTVALGGPITDPGRRIASPPPIGKDRKPDTDDDEDEEEEEFRETIGKSAGRLMSASTPTPASRADIRRLRTQSAYISPSPKSNVNSHSTAKTAGGDDTMSPGTLTRLRSRSTDRFGSPSLSSSSQSSTSSFASNRGEAGGVFSGGKFVDPLVLRKQEKARGKAPTATGGGRKVPVGQLVAFFDGDR
ncbi:hypothetical protein FIBSPDRAFT_793602 [Athelia psychrophila]|uniref:Uncharacterized protein n=1 Tax=Athelia psychrophila TaxID=1759441 RepID=A0A166FMS9_9AGAM|nr:hypothetical protein FIBSPDRAFT_793602 [Fibularhizoctonia sp. CBS 109695]